MKRPKITKALTLAATHYWVKKLYSVHEEVGLNRRGKIRADIIAFNMKQQVVITEVKSCWQDYTTDTKWHSYLPFCEQMYFQISHDLWTSKHGKTIANDLKPHGVGIMVLQLDGYVTVVKNAKKRECDQDFKNWLMTKLAWRGGNSKANMKRRKRIYLE